MGAFDFLVGPGGEKAYTYDAVQKRQQMADALMSNIGQPTTFGGGLGAVGSAIASVITGRDADSREAKRSAMADGVFESAMSGVPQDNSALAAALGGGMPQMLQSQGAAQPAPYSITPGEAPGAASFGPDGLVRGLTARGLPEHVAQGFALNAQDESGFNPGINEANPTVAGSRGGFGLMQWTGPRRVALEKFAQSTGRPLADPDVQMDFLVQELQGPESRAAKAILSAPDTGSAAAAIVSNFLRPAKQHETRRIAEYTGGAAVPSGGGQAAPMQTNVAFAQPQMPISRGVNVALIRAMGNPYLSPEQKQILSGVYAQQQAMQITPLQAEELRMKQEQHAYDMNKPVASAELPTSVRELQFRAEAAGMVPGTPEFQQFMLNNGGDPATFRALDMQAQAAGLVPGTPDYQQFMATRGAGLSAGAAQTSKNVADIETGGEAARVKAAGAEQGKADVVSGSELVEMQRNMPSLLVVVDQLEALADKATYTKAGKARDEAAKQMGWEPGEGAIARAEYVAVIDNQILPLLRQTFGAAFTQKEGDTLKATLGNPDGSPEEKKAVLRAFIAQKERDLVARGGTVEAQPPDDGWTEVQPGVRIREKN